MEMPPLQNLSLDGEEPGCKTAFESKRGTQKSLKRSLCKRSAKVNKKALKRKCDRLVRAKNEQMEKMARLMIEESMSYAVIRKCWLCRNRFVKESGCNAVRCVCGGVTCYYCGGAMSTRLATSHITCPPLTTSQEIEHGVLEAVERTRLQLLQTYSNLTFKYDPSASR
ncbi:hypothetical protein J6590_034099 [Homalodisca vitripennis]|nr:hypothetical protein J6590_034099 [Homalodisca vitripennis]